MSAKRGWTGRTRGGVFGNWVFIRLIRSVGLYPAYGLLLFVALYFVGFAPLARRSSFRYLGRLGLGSSSVLSRCWNSYRHFFAYGITLIDRIAVLSGSVKRFTFDFEGEAEIRGALSRGRGLVLVGGHFGNWELAAQLLAGLNVPVNILLFEGEQARVQGLMGTVFRERKWNLIPLGGSGEESFKALAALRNGEIVAVLGDRSNGISRRTEVAVRFLGGDVNLPTGPYLLAAIAGAGVIHAFAARTRLFHYRFYVYPTEYPALPDRANRQAEMKKWTELFASRLETLVKAHPYQWNNFFDYWHDDA
jgi:predicted LPLAT superfamily acyltransferase